MAFSLGERYAMRGSLMPVVAATRAKAGPSLLPLSLIRLAVAPYHGDRSGIDCES